MTAWRLLHLREVREGQGVLALTVDCDLSSGQVDERGGILASVRRDGTDLKTGTVSANLGATRRPYKVMLRGTRSHRDVWEESRRQAGGGADRAHVSAHIRGVMRRP